MIPINRRLKKVSEYVIGEKLADIGSDHAFLPMYCIEQNITQSAIAGEVIPGPYSAAVKSVERHGFQKQIDIRLGNGLTILNPESDHVDSVTICGMGGPLIAKILNEGFKHIPYRPRLILQSNIQSEPIRQFLQSNGYQIITETLIKERAHIYEIIVADPGTMTLSDRDLKFGPYLHPEPSELFAEKWTREIEALEDIKKQLDPVRHKKRYDEITRQENEINEVINQ
ncbi:MULTISPECIES: tRNA (adenine(22)-N(1))-methyltransferase TrmK [unclassified Staphylococcus]|uniref:tRNA (adenine(22)-N(1))-methyltransferase n=1 Tax=unclassified Staphylococcus TaxID=91994 RepID=UPI0021D0ED26|nr:MULTISPECIES: tRNA (adenine(22)-N(1))-methyltransferase TrmK [unclassified Staphylococcus]UXR68657.1 tRNA (adenine(22)-N(1))-methyltransferase TrmK [Staphylococcus sp. IVB6246]UXR70715.1 tRNA (adenine(22)-N(1))-methyltransferase TrmK [Staphylococcus sp. IVB6240]UXR72945.1 tRNA (adenine(22)-N(1))-methyltransferase TrmK [Staphylococcus sp. IVB6238]UXR75241.1 tRNA (adenine(22)-N(1))-methyltransferase TrmK [Staphylococcus sp. IVB6233]UXR79441.1 tRNA (adenine(22)-N(1))-methyltransferase TrmK [St